MPYFRTKRAMKPGPNSGYSSWRYVHDKMYAEEPHRYVRAYLLIQKDLERIFEFVEPGDLSSAAYSFRILELLVRTCVEIEANFKAILDANGYKANNANLTMATYKKCNASHHLSSYKVLLPLWEGSGQNITPFAEWATGGSLSWYQAYNASKHDRHKRFKEANLGNLVNAVAGLLVLLTSQFGDEDFSAGGTVIGASGLDYHEMEPSLGSLFRIAPPQDWSDDELYDFDWNVLKNQTTRFARFNYAAIK